VPSLQPPGKRTLTVYKWLAVLSPIFLLFLGFALLVIGLSEDATGVATLGAAAVVLSLLLPQMQGRLSSVPVGSRGLFEKTYSTASWCHGAVSRASISFSKRRRARSSSKPLPLFR
jgi:hypothetical protein